MPPDRRPPAWFLLLASALTAAGVWLRVERLPFHSNVWGVDWLHYYEIQARHLHRGEVFAWLTTWEGLHPPVSGAIHGLLMNLGLSWAGHWAATTAASVAAPWLLAWVVLRRVGPVPALFLLGWLLLSPMQVNYALNTSPYPWALVLGAAGTAAFLRAIRTWERRDFLLAAFLVGTSLQTHVLCFSIAVAQGLVLLSFGPRTLRERRAALAPAALLLGGLALWMVVASIGMTSDPWTFHVGETEDGPVAQALQVLRGRFGAWSPKLLAAAVPALAAALGLALGDAARRREIGLLLLEGGGILVALLLFYALHVADSRLSHYYLLPHALLWAAGALGLGTVAARGGRLPAVVYGAALLAAGPWLASSWTWTVHVADAAEAQIAASDSDTLLPFWTDAGEGDVVVYLWDATFLNDEPEHLDPVAARWPVARLGRSCFDEEAPRGFCHREGGARFYFAPSAYHEPLQQVEEPLRLFVNRARAPGRATVISRPNQDAPARPWPMEAWLAEHGAVHKELPGGSLLWQFPAGAVIPDPPPLHP